MYLSWHYDEAGLPVDSGHLSTSMRRMQGSYP